MRLPLPLLGLFGLTTACGTIDCPEGQVVVGDRQGTRQMCVDASDASSGSGETTQTGAGEHLGRTAEGAVDIAVDREHAEPWLQPCQLRVQQTIQSDDRQQRECGDEAQQTWCHGSERLRSHMVSHV